MNFGRRMMYRLLFRYLRVHKIYRDIVLTENHSNTGHYHREKIEALLKKVNIANPHFTGMFTDFLTDVAASTDDEFFDRYSKLPVSTKADYQTAKLDILDRAVYDTIKDNRLCFDKGLFFLLEQVRRGKSIFSMATGGTTSQPLVVEMDATHAFCMMFSFFKCWYNMGWRPGDKTLIFYPNKIYDLDNYVKNNHFNWLTGFDFLLFDTIDVSTIQNLVKKIETYKPTLLLIFPSTLNQAAHIIREHKIPINFLPPLINVSGETFLDCQRHNASEIFSTSVIEDSYGSVELGEIAHEVSPGQYKLFSNFVYTEAVPVANGKHELIATIHHSSTFPFIRYQMGDLLEKRFDDTGAEYLNTINGKTSNSLLLPNATHLFPLAINCLANELNAQFSQAINDLKLTKHKDGTLELYFIIKTSYQNLQEDIATEAKTYFKDVFAIDTPVVTFTDIMNHDYRLKYRVIEDKTAEREFAGGIIGQPTKMAAIQDEAKAEV